MGFWGAVLSVGDDEDGTLIPDYIEFRAGLQGCGCGGVTDKWPRVHSAGQRETRAQGLPPPGWSFARVHRLRLRLYALTSTATHQFWAIHCVPDLRLSPSLVDSIPLHFTSLSITHTGVTLHS
jgi:hypothetical protein